MLNTEKVMDIIVPTFIDNLVDSHVEGDGILFNTRLGFNKKKLEERKPEVASILQEIGVDERPIISLADLTKLKDGSVWNELQSYEDFQTLELIVACSDACGFISNDPYTVQQNLARLTEISLYLSSKTGHVLLGDEEWLRLLRDFAADKISYLTDSQLIRSFIPNSQVTPEKRPQI